MPNQRVHRQSDRESSDSTETPVGQGSNKVLKDGAIYTLVALDNTIIDRVLSTHFFGLLYGP